MDRRSTESKPLVNFHGNADIFDTNAELVVEATPKHVQVLFDAASNDRDGISLASQFSWLKVLPVCFLRIKFDLQSQYLLTSDYNLLILNIFTNFSFLRFSLVFSYLARLNAILHLSV